MDLFLSKAGAAANRVLRPTPKNKKAGGSAPSGFGFLQLCRLVDDPVCEGERLVALGALAHPVDDE